MTKPAGLAELFGGVAGVTVRAAGRLRVVLRGVPRVALGTVLVCRHIRSSRKEKKRKLAFPSFLLNQI